MKKLKDILDSQFEPIKLDEAATFTSFLTEESDYEGPGKIITEEDDPFATASNDAAGGDAAGDPFGDNAGGGDAGGDPFGDNAGGGNDIGGGAGGSGNGGAGGEGGDGDSEGDDDKETSPIDDDSHEDDPEFNQGTGNPDDVTLSDEPSAKVKFNVEKIMQAVTSVIQTLSEDKLVEIEKIKTDVELIFNGKILNDEDLEFKNFRNAMFILKKICAKLDIAEANYLNRKMKEPALKKRDQLKQEIAAKKGELAQTRDVLTALDTK
jgi:hypothetical protein